MIEQLDEAIAAYNQFIARWGQKLKDCYLMQDAVTVCNDLMVLRDKVKQQG